MSPTIKPASPPLSEGEPAPSLHPLLSGRTVGASDIIPSELLFKGAQEILIRHQGDLYHLRITRNDKLILTK